MQKRKGQALQTESIRFTGLSHPVTDELPKICYRRRRWQVTPGVDCLGVLHASSRQLLSEFLRRFSFRLVLS